MKRDVSRQSYTKRILEIVSSIHKQQEEIERVIGDTRAVQKQMNKMKGRIDRTFTAIDEAMFKVTTEASVQTTARLGLGFWSPGTYRHDNIIDSISLKNRGVFFRSYIAHDTFRLCWVCRRAQPVPAAVAVLSAAAFMFSVMDRIFFDTVARQLTEMSQRKKTRSAAMFDSFA